MIAELFYPKELKGVIADLRAKDDLNEEALQRLNRYILRKFKIYLVICLAFMPLFIHPDMTSFYFALLWILFISIFAGLKQQLYKMTKLVLHLYNYGKFIPGECIYFARGGGIFHPRKYVMQVQFDVNDKKEISHIVGDDYPLNIKKYSSGDLVFVAYDPLNVNRNVPFANFLKELFYLRKTRPDDI